MKSVQVLTHSTSEGTDDRKTGGNHCNTHSTVGPVGPDSPGALVNQPDTGTNQEKYRAKALNRKAATGMRTAKKYTKKCSPYLIITDPHQNDFSNPKCWSLRRGLSIAQWGWGEGMVPFFLKSQTKAQYLWALHLGTQRSHFLEQHKCRDGCMYTLNTANTLSHIGETGLFLIIF